MSLHETVVETSTGCGADLFHCSCRIIGDERDVTCLETDVIGRSNTRDRKETLWPQKINLQSQSTE